MIVSASSSQSLAAALAAGLEECLLPVEYEHFPDGEFLAALSGSEVSGEDVLLVGATVSPKAHLELLQLGDALHEAGAAKIRLVLGYMGYARQDSAFRSGEPVSARAMARSLSTVVDEVLVVDPHESAVLEFFSVPASAVTAAGTLASGVADLDEPVFFAPDAGARELARTVRDAHGSGTIEGFEKTRHSAERIEIHTDEVAVEGREVVLVDDIIATGTTMANTAAVLAEEGADSVAVACVHAVLADSARTRLAHAGVDRVLSTDTIERAESTVSAAPAVIDAL